MNEQVCERIRMAAMAIEDGYTAELPIEKIESHLSACALCQSDIEQMKSLMVLLDRQKRRESQADIWSRIERRIRQTPREAERRDWHILLLAPLLLVGYKVAEFAAGREPAFAFKLVPVLVAIAVFALLRENPFKIKMGLKAEGE
jgi:predicted anti-sigma-YlaC factor YlaD